jgi:SET and MYND domain-containing protein
VTGNQQQREERILPTPTRALLSVAASEDKWREVSEKLVGNEDKWRDNKQAWGDMELQGRMVRSLLGVDPKWVGQGEAEVVERYASVLCKISTNSFNVTDLDLGNDSIFLDTTLAMANHSCIPNASAQIFGSNACLVAERPIAKDEEITISYIGSLSPPGMLHLSAMLTEARFVTSSVR